MEDDIDIEEHDVLDNPKIRDIFPDLSLVKTEVPDEPEDTEGLYAPLEYEPESEYVTEIKKENTSYEENYTDQYGHIDNFTSELVQVDAARNIRAPNEIAPSELENDTTIYEFGQNEIRSYEHEQNEDVINEIGENEDTAYSNKIILGTKPVPDYDTLYEEALHSNVTVSLENWEVILKNSVCYCNDCEILFPTINALDAHKSVSHSFLVALDTPAPNTARKSTTTKSSRYCNHCDKVFTDDTALIKHLYELLPLNNCRKPTPEPLKIDVNSTRYKCMKCKQYFATLAAGREHKQNVHPSLTNVNIICKVTKAKADNTATIALKTDAVKNEVPDGKLFSSNSLVPKSVLFRCHVCQVHFLSCYSANQHAAKCSNNTEYLRCKICRRNIRAKDFLLHSLQHKHALPGEKLRIYTLHKTISEKIYCKCPKCCVCFDERAFWSHYGLCRGDKINFTRCSICNIDIHQNRTSNHKSKHVMQKCTKKDFVVINFHNLSESNRELPIKQQNEVSGYKKINLNTVPHSIKIPLYYCNVCGTCKPTWSTRGHNTGNCKKISLRFCELCGLGFSAEFYKQHKNEHIKRKLILNDFKIMSMKTGLEIEVPTSNFHSCKRCKIHFLTKDRIQTHDCSNEPFEFCEICNKKFNLRAFTPHSNFHSHSKIPELLEKYNSINDMWNVLYKCSACDLVTTTYDSAVEHSQNHINGCRKPVSKECDVCHFDIIEPYYKLHMKLHTNKMTIDKNNFTILVFNFEKLYTTEWMEIFSTLPKAHKYLILSKSIYRYSRRFKFNCITKNQSDLMKIFCERCKIGINLEDTRKHYFDKKCKVSASYVCRTCHLHFSTIQDCILHEKNHDSIPKTYKVLTFNDEKDELFDQRLKDFELPTVSKAPEKSTKILNKLKTQIKSKKPLNLRVAIKNSKSLKNGNKKAKLLKVNRAKLYKCEKCGSCVATKKNMAHHKCSNTNRHTKCPKCNEVFIKNHLKTHMESHRRFPHLMKKPLVVKYKPKSLILPSAYIFQCQCGLHFTSKQSVEKHLEICNDGLEISKETCSKCNLLFPTDVLVTHLCKHHSKPMDIKVQVVSNKKIGQIKCAKCSIIYPNTISFDEHHFNCGTKEGKYCTKCKSKYDVKQFDDHKCMSNQKWSVVKEPASIATMYRCGPCNITYLNIKSLGYHFEHNHKSCRERATCPYCKLTFTAQSYNRHKEMHSRKENYMIKVIDPMTGHSVIYKGKNKAFKPSKRANESKLNKNVTVDQNNVDDDSEMAIDDTVVFKLYRCNECETCYRLKKRLERHLSMNHFSVHSAITCEICGLLFNEKLARSHNVVHKNGKPEYKFVIHEYHTGKITTITGKNPVTSNSTPNTSNKRSSNSTDYNTSRSKRARKNYSHITTEEPNTSKCDFETIDMTEVNNETVLSDSNIESGIDNFNVTNDPLNSSETSPPTQVGKSKVPNEARLAELVHTLSRGLKTLLNANMHQYSSTLYKCRICGIHFISDRSASCHIYKHKQYKFSSFPCDKCGLRFSYYTLKRHLYIHHTIMKLTRESFDIKVWDVAMSRRQALLASDPDHILPDYNIAEKIDLATNEPENVARVENKPKIQYYKCGDCNVCFIEEDTCREHCIEHSELDPKTYIECKICNFQFMIDSLKSHVTVHHIEEFFLEDLVITEYKPTEDSNPRIEVYQGIDKVQSKLVSTTTDVPSDSFEGDIVGI